MARGLADQLEVAQNGVIFSARRPRTVADPGLRCIPELNTSVRRPTPGVQQ